MKFRMCFLLSAVVMAGLMGCSAETKDKAKDALDKTGDAAVSAGKDAAENIEKGAEKVGDALDGDASK